MEEKPNIEEQPQSPEETVITEIENSPQENKKRSPEIKRLASAMMASAVLGLSFFDAEKLAAEPKELKLPPTTEKTLTPEEVRIAQLRTEMGASQKVERISSPAEKRIEHLKYMQKMANESPTEHYSVSITKEGKKGNAFFVETESGGDERFVLLPTEDVGEAAKDKKAIVEIAHTHPIKAIEEISNEQKETGPYIMPPSILDLISHVQQIKTLKLRPSQFKDTVVDPTGFWEMSMNSESTLYEKLSDAIDASQEIFLEDFGISEADGEFLVELIKTEEDELSKAKNVVEGFKLLAAKFPQHSSLLQKAGEAITSMKGKQTMDVIKASADAAEIWPEQETAGDELDTTLKTSWKDLQTYENGRPMGQSTEEEIKDFVDFWSKRGLKLKYTQFKDLETNETK